MSMDELGENGPGVIVIEGLYDGFDDSCEGTDDECPCTCHHDVECACDDCRESVEDHELPQLAVLLVIFS